MKERYKIEVKLTLEGEKQPDKTTLGALIDKALMSDAFSERPHLEHFLPHGVTVADYPEVVVK